VGAAQFSVCGVRFAVYAVAVLGTHESVEILRPTTPLSPSNMWPILVRENTKKSPTQFCISHPLTLKNLYSSQVYLLKSFYSC
jgi:hypothetical protein